jgi:hypothetical protein
MPTAKVVAMMDMAIMVETRAAWVVVVVVIMPVTTTGPKMDGSSFEKSGAPTFSGARSISFGSD